MTIGYIQGDLSMPLVHAYLKLVLKRWECVKDVFRIEVVDCIKPGGDLLYLPTGGSRRELLTQGMFDPAKGRSPQEIASIMSQYRYMKQIAEGDPCWIMEHDAVLRPDHEEQFRITLQKAPDTLVCNIGIAMECYTVHPEVAKKFCFFVENDFDHKHKGPMGMLHTACDLYSKQINNKTRNVWWPKKGRKNETGLSHDVSSAFSSPMRTISAPVTQVMDKNFGSTVTDRPNVNPDYDEKTHPNFEFVTLDLNH